VTETSAEPARPTPDESVLPDPAAAVPPEAGAPAASETAPHDTRPPVNPGSAEPVAAAESTVDADSADRQAGRPAGFRAAFSSAAIAEQFGGPMGMVDSGLPVVVFVIVNIIAGLGPAIGAALSAGVIIAILRLVRHRPVTQAISGLLGVGVAAFIAYRLGSARGYFLLGIWSALLYGGLLLVSVLVRWPLVGVAWEALNGRGTAWRADRRLRRRYDIATLIWVAMFAVRYLVQRFLYDRNDVGGLAVAKLLLGYPLWIAAALATVVVVGTAGGMRMPSLRRRRPSEPESAD
jgi:hypothetical protein